MAGKMDLFLRSKAQFLLNSFPISSQAPSILSPIHSHTFFAGTQTHFLGIHDLYTISDGDGRNLNHSYLKSTKYPSVMELGTWHLYLNQRRSKKYINHMKHPLESAEICIFHQKLAIFVISGNKKKTHFSTQFLILMICLIFILLILLSF